MARKKTESETDPAPKPTPPKSEKKTPRITDGRGGLRPATAKELVTLNGNKPERPSPEPRGEGDETERPEPDETPREE